MVPIVRSVIVTVMVVVVARVADDGKELRVPALKDAARVGGGEREDVRLGEMRVCLADHAAVAPVDGRR